MFDSLIGFLLSQNQLFIFILSVPLVAIGELGFPIPIFLESILLFAGYKVSQGYFSYFLTAIFSIAGSSIGASILYYLSKFFGEKILARYKLFDDYRSKIETQLKTYEGWEPFAVAALRLTPGFFIPTTIASGIFEVPYFKFILGVVISAIVYDIIFLSAGIILGKNAAFFAWNVSLLFKAAIILLLVPFAFFLWKKLQANRK